MKKLLTAVIVFSLIAAGAAFLVQTMRKNPDFNKRECPDEWIDNQMPVSVTESEETQYFIVKGERQELVDYDVDWIEDNCALEIQVVH